MDRIITITDIVSKNVPLNLQNIISEILQIAYNTPSNSANNFSCITVIILVINQMKFCYQILQTANCLIILFDIKL